MEERAIYGSEPASQNKVSGRGHEHSLLGAATVKSSNGEACTPATCTPATVRATVEVPAHHPFSAALGAAMHGHRVTRLGWNGPNQYVAVQFADRHSKMSVPYLYLKNAHGDLVPWVPSQGDLFASDWAILPR